ncbi:type VI secretion system protein ImpJ [Luteibacter rhizovicinus]|uniref:Type VI secretion system protein ImpJ n=2 Tax=Luteibacter rhizovicinus TaxID=242606 RepID=A0A4R3Z0R2_9GAMM|nr:type VI secretion system protein ImpJ [Luteibacter rhizovicinus]
MIDRADKVVWSEGMFLQPHHLQQQDRHVAGQLAAALRAVRTHAWGFTELEIDNGELAAGHVRLARCAGILRDGTPFVVKGDADAMPSCVLPEGARDIDIVLAMPLARPDAVESEVRPGLSSLARFHIVELQVADSHQHGGDIATLQLARPHLRLMTESDAQAAHTYLGVARVVERGDSGVVTLDAHYIPPVLGWRVSARLATLLHSFLTQLRQRVHDLMSALRAPGFGGVVEVQQFLLAQTLGRAEATLGHIAGQADMHPERLYVVLLALRGELAVFESPYGSAPLRPPYRHDRLASCFAPLVAELRRAIAVAVAENVVALPVEEHAFGMHHARVGDASLYADARFILGVSTRLPVERLLQTLPESLKIGPAENMRDLVDLQLPGLPLRAIPGAPRELPAYPGFSYFELDRQHPQWIGFAGSSGIGLHVAGDFPELRFALWAIRKER